jgi:chromate transport protein ChrA
MSYEEHYGAKRKAMSRRNWIRWICAWSTFVTYLFFDFPYPLIITLIAISIVSVINRRDINKTHNEIMKDIEKRYSKPESGFGLTPKEK